jgi:hypothetical protein
MGQWVVSVLGLGPLHLRVTLAPTYEVLVNGQHAGGVQLARGHGGAQHVELVEGGLGVDLVLPPCRGEAVVGDGDLELLGWRTCLLRCLPRWLSARIAEFTVTSER